jgi:hypothetical protein
MAEPGDQVPAVAPWLAALGLLAAVSLGSWWTALAVVAGEPATVLLRFALSLGGGWYYLILYRLARGRRALSGPR